MDMLPPGGELALTLRQEKAIFADVLLREVRAALGTPDEDGTVPITEPLRMTGMASEGRVLLIGFELDGEAFWLKPGQSRQGVTLLSVERGTDQAFLTHKGRMVRLTLSSKLIASVDLARLEAAIKNAKPESPLRMLDAADVKEHGTEFVRILELTSTQLDALYAEAVAHPERFTDEAAFKLRLQALTPLAQMTAQMLPDILKGEKRAAEQFAALRKELVALSQSSK